MTTEPAPREPQLTGQTVLVIGGSSGIGLETARRARAEGAEVVITGRNAQRLATAGPTSERGRPRRSNATDPDALDRFFRGLPGPVDHVMVTAGGSYYAPLADIDFNEGRRAMDEHVWLTLRVGQNATTSAASNCGPSCPSAGWSSRPTSPPSPCTSWSTPQSPARPTTSTAAAWSSGSEPAST
jgi:NAD(P)-dependent dehydrogenase (short-subunit alcohol dehydrogenase family)